MNNITLEQNLTGRNGELLRQMALDEVYRATQPMPIELMIEKLEKLGYGVIAPSSTKCDDCPWCGAKMT